MAKKRPPFEVISSRDNSLRASDLVYHMADAGQEVGELGEEQYFELKPYSKGLHVSGVLDYPIPETILVHSETSNYYIGTPLDDTSAINVKFRKEDCRPLSDEETEKIKRGNSN